MSKRKDDISQLIKQYLNGELDARAMHQLEQEALKDPFLMEALEGYEQFDADQQKNISDIQARLKARIAKKERRIIPWRMISIAASVLIALTIGGLWVFDHSSETNEKVTAQFHKTQPAIKPTPPNLTAASSKPVTAKTDEIVAKPYRTKARPAATAIAIAEQPPKGLDKDNDTNKLTASTAKQASLTAGAILKDTIPLNEVVVLGYATQRRTDVTGSVSTVTPAVITDKTGPPIANELQGKVAGVYVLNTKTKTITGVVTDASLPIPGALVKIKGTSIGTQTDVKGRFTLHSVPQNAVLSVSFIGYVPKDVNLHKTDSLVIAMVPSSQSLNEVVVTSYGISRKQDTDDEIAHPANGWADLYKYIKDNAVSPDGKAGVVKLSFMVNTDNSLSDFKILKSVSAQTDTAAIELIQNGQRWRHNTNGFAEKVRLRIKFVAKK